MTAEKFKDRWCGGFDLDINQIEDLMIEFAKYHVEQALKEAAEKVNEALIPICSDHTPCWGACVSCGGYDNPEVIKDEEELKESILEAYPLTNIK